MEKPLQKQIIVLMGSGTMGAAYATGSLAAPEQLTTGRSSICRPGIDRLDARQSLISRRIP